MYNPGSYQALPIVLSTSEALTLLRGGRSRDPVFTRWAQWCARIEEALLPDLYDSNASFPAAHPVAYQEGRRGTIWLSTSFANLILSVYADCLMMTKPDLPVTPFWAGVQPYWVPQKVPAMLTEQGPWVEGETALFYKQGWAVVTSPSEWDEAHAERVVAMLYPSDDTLLAREQFVEQVLATLE